MNKVKTYILRLLPCLCAALMASCSQDDAGDINSGTAHLRISVIAMEEGDLNSRAAGDMETGTTGEFMNDNLLVMLVNASGNVALKLTPDLTANTAAQEGNLKSWVSETIELEAGDYTAYAFANINDTYYDSWSSLVESIVEGSAFDVSVFNDIVLEDPAGKLDFDGGMFIPLSATPLSVSVTAATSGISIGMDRLVGKIRATIEADAGVEVSALTIGGYADRVTLMSDASLPAETQYNLSTTVQVNQTISSGGSLQLADFYVNETSSGHPFSVDVVTSEMGGTTYSATTTTNALPRNYIFPLTLHLNDFELAITATVYAAPIGYYAPVYVNAVTETTYEVTVPTGWTFGFEVTGVGGSLPTTCNWTLDGDTNYIYFDGDNPTYVEGTSVTGACSAASNESTYKIYIYAQGETNGISFTRTYTLLVNVTDNWPDEYLEQLLSGSSSARGVVRSMLPEVLTMSNIY